MRSHALRPEFFALPLLATLSSSALAQGLRLNGPLARPRGGDVLEYHLSADGTRVVYLADQGEDERVELYLIRATAGGIERRTLNGPLVAGGDVSPNLVLAPDESRLVYVADQDTNDQRELYSVALDGGAPVKLNLPLAVNADVLGLPESVRITSDSAHVVFLAGALNALELFVAPLDGSSPAVRLSDPSHGRVQRFVLSPDGTHAVYKAGAHPEQLYSSVLDGSRAPLALLANSPFERNITPFEVSADGTRVVFCADARIGERYDLFVVGIDGGGEIELYSQRGADVLSFRLVGERVVFVSGPNAGRMEVLSRPLDASSAAQLLSPALSSTVTYTTSPDGARVAILAEPSGQLGSDLFVVPADGSAPAVQVNPTLVPLGSVYGGMEFSPDSARLVYQAVQDNYPQLELYSAPADASAPPIKLNPALPTGSQLAYGFAFAADDGVVFRGDVLTRGVQELFAVPLTGGSAVKLNGPLVNNGDVEAATFQVPDGAYRISADGRVVAYLADQEEDGVLELYAGPTRGNFAARKLNLALPIGPLEGDVVSYRLTPDGQEVVYLADQLENDVQELFVVQAHRGQTPRRLNAPLVQDGDVLSMELSPDGTRVVYRADAEVDGRPELYTQRLDGTGLPLRLNPPFAAEGGVYEGFAFTPDGTRVVFARQNAAGTPAELLSVPADGSAPAVLLSQSAIANGGFSNQYAAPWFLVTPDSAQVVFVGDLATNEMVELWRAPIDGSAAPVKLSGPLQQNGDVFLIGLSPDGARVLFWADAFLDRQTELFSAPVDGSSAAVELDGTLLPGMTPIVDAGSRFALFKAFSGNAEQLFRVPLDGSAPPSSLTPNIPAGMGIGTDVQVVGEQALFRARVPGRFEFQLFAVPLDGSAAPVRLSRSVPWRSAVTSTGFFERSFLASPDGRSVAFLLSDASIELYVVPVDGSAPARRLTAPTPPAVQADFVFTPDSRAIVYRREALVGREEEVFVVPLAGGAPLRIGGPEPVTVTDFRLSDDGRRVITHGFSPATPNALELFLSFLPPSNVAAR